MVEVDLEAEALWASLPREVRSHAWRLVATKRTYEALRVLMQGTGSGPKARALVAWLAKAIVKGEQ